LSAPAVVGPLNPADDRDPQLITGRPRPPVEDVLLQQGEEALHRGVVPCRADLAHRTEQAVVVQGVHELA